MGSNQLDYNRFWSPAFDDMSAFVCIVDCDYNVVKANGSFFDFFAGDGKKLIGKKCFEIFHSLKKPFPGCPYGEVLKSGGSEKGEIYDPSLNKYLSITVTPIFDDDLGLIGSIHVAEDVTRLREDEENLKIRNDFIDKSMTPFAIGDPQGNLLYVNAACLKLWGYASGKEVIGKPIVDFWKDRTKIVEIAKALKNKNGWMGELIAKKKDGTAFDCHVVSNVVTDKSGNARYIVSSFADMTLRYHMAKALAESEKKYQLVIENAADCIYLLDTKGRFIHVNRRALELSEIKDPTSMIGKKFADFVVVRYREAAAGHVRKALSGETVQFRYETLMPKKKRRWWEATFIPIKDVKGRVINILNISHDLTRERESKARFEFFREYAENVLANVPISVLVVNRAGNVVFANRNFITKMRKAETDIVGRNISEIMPADVMAKTGWQTQIGEVLKTRDIVMGQKFEYRGKTFNYHMVPMRESVGRRHNVAIVMEDITERIALETQLQHSEKLAMMGQFTAGVAHEINNPLSIIKGNIQYLREQIKTGVDFHSRQDFRELKDTLAAVEQETVRCGEIITDLLHFAKKSEGKRKTLVDVNHVVRHVLHLMGRQLELKGIKVERELKPRMAKVRGNHDLLQQVVMNLVINSEQAVTKRGIINIKTLQNAKKVYIVVKDNGRGIPKELMGFIFNPFFTTKEAEKGTGLGLSVAHAIVEDHGGTIGVRSAPKKGSVFTIALPIAK